MLGKNPTIADNVGVLTPQLTDSLPGMVYERVKSFTNVDLIPQVSGDLVHWRSGSSYLSTAVTQDLGTKERLRSSLLAQTSAPVFLRLMPARPSQSQLTAILIQPRIMSAHDAVVFMSQGIHHTGKRLQAFPCDVGLFQTSRLIRTAGARHLVHVIVTQAQGDGEDVLAVPANPPHQGVSYLPSVPGGAKEMCALM